ncbi:MAG: hydantoinase/oxoprolinase family protein, partial [Armatimonadetes bacterium]|nr:hydantoinase/oxoprolinase family protein [Armatimonadota bacterium]
STTVCNAYVQPLVDHYLEEMERALAARGFAGGFFLMQSTGAVTSPQVARQLPVRLLESGPAGGALAAAYFGERIGRPDLVAFDMGGTTAKICVIEDGRPEVAASVEVARVHRFKRGSGLPVRTPVVEMIEIGAGGGSIARLDAMGLMRVGPESAEASPGPACYGFGGTEATVTDACVVLGYFDPAAFLGGTMPVDRQAAVDAVTRIGAQVGLDGATAAWGILSIVCENMAQAARVHIIERGQDPRRYALMGFGGAGPATAARVARLLGMREVIIPRASGLASALGLLVAPLGFDLVHSLVGDLEHLDWTQVDGLLRALEERGRRQLHDAGAPAAAVACERYVAMRYEGQFHEIEIPVPDGAVSAGLAAALREQFLGEYGRLYGITLNGYPIQTLNWRVLLRGPRPPVEVGTAPAGSAADAQTGQRRAYFAEAGGFVAVPVFERDRLAAGASIPGPALVEEREATAVVGVGDRLTVDAMGNLVILVGGSRA